MERVICLLIGYLFGLIQTGYIYGKTQKVDIRTMGSGNAGTTNALRTLGWKAGLVTLVGDICKCFLAVGAAYLLFGQSHGDNISLLAFYAGMGAVLGHNFPFYLGFRGGKGIATTVGLIISTLPLWLAALVICSFLIVVAITRFVSLGSLIMVSLYFLVVCIGCVKHLFTITPGHEFEAIIIAAILTFSAFYRHKANIKRLLSGTENKLSVGKSKK